MIEFGHRQVGEGTRCFITFEAGPTHDGVEKAKALIDAAADAGGDAVKFQILNPDRLVADRTLPFSYDVLVNRETGATETVSEPLYDILCRRALSDDEWADVKSHADERGLPFFATVGFPEEIELLERLSCDSIKIASLDVDHHVLIRHAARTGMCIQLDTGNSTLGEIEAAVDVIRAEGNERIIVHQCPSGYPARLESINIRIIHTLKAMFPGIAVAFSDHSPERDMDIAAVAMGAHLVEKTITLDKMTRSVEHVMSLEPAEMKHFVQAIRDVETAIGGARRLMSPEEMKQRVTWRRSIHAINSLPAGHVLSEDDLDYRRPGFGIPPTEVDRLIGSTLTRAIEAGALLTWSDIGS